jgi:hypothetical protein
VDETACLVEPVGVRIVEHCPPLIPRTASMPSTMKTFRTVCFFFGGGGAW